MVVAFIANLSRGLGERVIARRAGVEGEVWLVEGHRPSFGHGCRGNMANGDVG